MTKVLGALKITGMYLFCVLAWGSSYFVVKYQIGRVPLNVSLSYRLAIADLIFFAILLFRRRPLPFRLKDHLALAAFGFGNFAGSYSLLYLATAHLTSAYVTLIFSTKVIMTPITTALLLRRPLDRRVLIGGGIGILGVALILTPQFQTMGASDLAPAWALAVAVLGTLVTSLGDVASARNSSAGIQALQANAFGFLYGLAFLALFIFVRRDPIVIDLSPNYLRSLLWLALVSSVLAWLFYLNLVGQIGPSKAGYMVALFPVVGVGVSVAFEGMLLTPYLIVGVLFAVLGNMVAMTRTR